jgi:glycosyltransferase involved in cell wall biosynthesis
VLGVENTKKFQNLIENQSKFIFSSYVEEELLEKLYKEAFALLYPSLNEGFGYPPIESMKYGTPVIASATSAITEICSDSAVYFNPYSKREIRNRLLMMAESSSLRKKYVEKSIERFRFVREKQEKMLERLVNILLSYV